MELKYQQEARARYAEGCRHGCIYKFYTRKNIITIENAPLKVQKV